MDGAGYQEKMQGWGTLHLSRMPGVLSGPGIALLLHGNKTPVEKSKAEFKTEFTFGHSHTHL